MEGVAEALRQIRDGKDFAAPSAILRISEEAAARTLPGWPYSIAENVAHTAYWQRIWLDRLLGRTKAARLDFVENWPKVPPNSWQKVRDGFLTDLATAIAVAEGAKPHVLSEAKAIVTLARIAHHDAYHVGHWALLKRLLRKSE